MLTLVFINESIHLTPVAPPEPSFKVGPCKASSGTCMGELQLPLFSVNELPLLLKVSKSTVFIPPPLQLGLDTYIADPLHHVVDLLRKYMVLLEEFNIALGVGANGLGETDGDGMKKVEVDRGVILELATNNRVVGPLDFDEIGNALAPVFFGDF